MLTATQVIEKISTESNTYFELNRRVRLLRNLVEKKIYGNAINQEENITAEDENWLHTLDEAFLSNFNPESTSEIFKSIDEELQKIIPLIIYIPFEMPATNIKEFGTYIKQSFGATALFELRYDPSLIAGCSLVWKGQIKDYSLRAKITQSKKEIFSTFISYLK